MKRSTKTILGGTGIAALVVTVGVVWMQRNKARRRCQEIYRGTQAEAEDYCGKSGLIGGTVL